MPRPKLTIVRSLPTLHNLRELASIYVASPYSRYRGGIDSAHYDVGAVMKRLKDQEVYGLYSPIGMWHEWAYLLDIPTDAAQWRRENEHKLRYASALLVVELEGWEESDGVKAEIEYAKQISKPIFYINPETLELRK